MAAVHSADKNRPVNRKEKREVIQAVPEADKCNRALCAFEETAQDVHGFPLMMAAHDMKESPLGPPKSLGFYCAQKTIVRGSIEHKRLAVLPHHGERSFFPGEPCQGHDFIDVHVAEPARGGLQTITKLHKAVTNLRVRGPQRYHLVAVLRVSFHRKL